MNETTMYDPKNRKQKSGMPSGNKTNEKNIGNQFDKNIMNQNSFSNFNPMMNQTARMDQYNMMNCQMMNLNMNMNHGNMMNDQMINHNMNMDQGNKMKMMMKFNHQTIPMNQMAMMMNNIGLNINDSSQNESKQKISPFMLNLEHPKKKGF